MTGRTGFDLLSDEDLVRTVQEAGSGDLRAFELLVNRHHGRVLANCRYLTRAAHEAEDLAQEVFVRAYFGISGFRRDAAFGTWLNRIKVNHCLNFLAKRERRARHIAVDDPEILARDELVTEPVAERWVEAGNQRERIGLVLDAMAETLRVPLLMRDLDGLSYQEIADALGVGLSAVKMRIKRAREEFRERYAALEAEERVDDDGDSTRANSWREAAEDRRSAAGGEG